MGRPKALLRVGGVPLVARVVSAASSVVDEIVVMTRSAAAPAVERILPHSVRVIRDRRRLQTPLVGLVHGAARMRSGYVAALGCDLPFLAPVLLERLFQEANGRDAAIPRWPNGMIEPLVAVYRRRALAGAAREALDRGGRSNQDMIDLIGDVAWIPVSRLRRSDRGPDPFLNVNTPAELRMARRLVLNPQRVRRQRRR